MRPTWRWSIRPTGCSCLLQECSRLTFWSYSHTAGGTWHSSCLPSSSHTYSRKSQIGTSSIHPLPSSLPAPDSSFSRSSSTVCIGLSFTAKNICLIVVLLGISTSCLMASTTCYQMTRISLSIQWSSRLTTTSILRHHLLRIYHSGVGGAFPRPSHLGHLLDILLYQLLYLRLLPLCPSPHRYQQVQGRLLPQAAAVPQPASLWWGGGWFRSEFKIMGRCIRDGLYEGEETIDIMIIGHFLAWVLV